MTITRRQLFATLAAAVTAPFLPAPPVVIPFRRITARVHIKDDAFVAYYRANLNLACEHPATSGWITGINGKTFQKG